MIRKVLLLARSQVKPVNVKSFSTSAVKNAHAPEGSGVYRADTPPVTYGPKYQTIRALQVLLWWHMFYSFWYDPEMVFGHPQYQLPDRSLWTDEELGIPPDDYDEIV